MNKIIKESTWNKKKVLVEIADTFLKRFNGLMLRQEEDFPIGRCLLISPCNSIHMCFMHFPIDIVFLDKNKKVLRIKENVPVWTGLAFCFNAESVLEFPVGSIAHYGIKEGQILSF